MILFLLRQGYFLHSLTKDARKGYLKSIGGIDFMDENRNEMIRDLKSYLEYLKGMGIVSLPVSDAVSEIKPERTRSISHHDTGGSAKGIRGLQEVQAPSDTADDRVRGGQ